MLDYHGVPYDVVEVNPLTKSEMKFSTEWKKVPILMIDDEQLNDSSAIMRAIEKRVGAKGAGSGWGGMSAAEKESEWLAWVDDRFVHVVTPNIYRTWGEAFRSFDYITERGNFNWAERQRCASRAPCPCTCREMSSRASRYRGRAEELYKCLRRWSEEAVGKQPFCGISQPRGPRGVRRHARGQDLRHVRGRRRRAGGWVVSKDAEGGGRRHSNRRHRKLKGRVATFVRDPCESTARATARARASARIDDE